MGDFKESMGEGEGFNKMLKFKGPFLLFTFSNYTSQLTFNSLTPSWSISLNIFDSQPTLQRPRCSWQGDAMSNREMWAGHVP